MRNLERIYLRWQELFRTLARKILWVIALPGMAGMFWCVVIFRLADRIDPK